MNSLNLSGTLFSLHWQMRSILQPDEEVDVVLQNKKIVLRAVVPNTSFVAERTVTIELMQRAWLDVVVKEWIELVTELHKKRREAEQ